MKNRFIKILLAMIVFFSGTRMAMADNQCDYFYPHFKETFKVIAALNYYYSYKVIDDEEPISISAVYSQFEIDSTIISLDDFESLARTTKTNSERTMGTVVKKILAATGVCDDDTSTTFCTDRSYKLSENEIELKVRDLVSSIGGYQSFTMTQKYFREMLETTARWCGQKEDYDDLINKVYVPINNFCDYLKTHKGVNYYVVLVRRIVTYSTLALALILGALDFIKAITSHDDAALTKAFQTFVKRLAAVVVIFLSYIIVQIIMGLVTKIPNYSVSEMEICQELKMSST